MHLFVWQLFKCHLGWGYAWKNTLINKWHACCLGYIESNSLLKNNSSVIIFSPSCHYKPYAVICSFFCLPQKVNNLHKENFHSNSKKKTTKNIKHHKYELQVCVTNKLKFKSLCADNQIQHSLGVIRYFAYSSCELNLYKQLEYHKKYFIAFPSHVQQNKIVN